jgi:hypothetical protein
MTGPVTISRLNPLRAQNPKHLLSLPCSLLILFAETLRETTNASGFEPEVST